MKKAEIIKNGNVNLKPIKTGIDWDKVSLDFTLWRSWKLNGKDSSDNITKWFKKRIEKELQSGGSKP
jgi:hypothetical protein